MRKYLIIALLLSTTSLLADHVDPQTAHKVATTFLNNNGAKATQLTDLSKSAGFQNLYIFTTEQGFVVMSADDCVQPILGYSLTGSFVTEGMPENLRWWLQGYNDQIQDAIDNNLSSAKTEWQNLKNDIISKETNETIVVGPLITTLWDQTYPYNYYCPSCSSGGNGGHVYTGCVATAMAQVLKYWNYPTKGNGSHSYTHPTYGEQTANFGETTYDWSNMPNSLSSSSSQTNIDAIATLIYHCGVAVEMNYGSGSSGAYSLNVPPAFINYFRLSPSSTYVSRDGYEDAKWIAFLKNELDEGRPMYYSGSNSNSGHAFVCDGYRSDDYFHFNWGWSGYDGAYGNSHGNNGYWAIGALSPGSGGSGSGSGTYNLDNAVIAWVEPISDLTAPTLSASISENTVTLTWNIVAGAASYDIYKDNAKIASTTGLSFIDSNVSFGDYNDYYIRAVSTNNKSNPSNFVTIAATYQNRIPQDLNATIALSDNSVNLTWTEPQSQSMDLHYGIGQANSFYGANVAEGTYWGQCYPAQSISAFAGMAIDHVSIYLGNSGNYSLYIYKENVTTESNLLASENFTSSIGWNEIALTNSIPLDTSKDLWIVFYTNSVDYPAYYGDYSGANQEHAHYLWYNFSEDIKYSIKDNISWPIKIHLNDGAFTFNVYRDNELIAEQQPINVFQDVNLTDGTHEYYIKSYSNYWESDASNIASITYTTEHVIADAVTIPVNLVLSRHNKYKIVSTGVLSVAGSLSNADEDNLIIEDGGQLIHSSTGVKATVKQSIAAYTNGKNGWRLVSVPVADGATPSDANGWLNGSNYDLYYYDEPTRYWKNIKATGSGFDIDYTKGYLYANSDGTQLQSAGTLQPSVEDYTVKNLSYTNTLTSLRGFNLVGNPFVCNATVNKDFYVMNPAGTEVELAANDRQVTPCEGIFVVATESDRTVTFSRATAKSTPGNCIDVILTKNDIEIDRARVRFGDDDNLEKFNMSESSTRLYFPDADKDFAVVYTHPESELPLNFQADSEGSYHLSVDIDGVELAYLHLIDNLTGADIDLLTTPDYAFDARANDYASRFQLRFTERNTNENNIPSDFIEGDLQILDVTGRVVGTDPQMKLTPGVYVIRSVKSDEIKTKKIIIK